MAKHTSKNAGNILQTFAGSIVRVYEAGGFLLTFIFIGAAMMIGSKWIGGENSSILITTGAVLTFACLGLFGWGHVYAALETSRQMPGVRKFCKQLEGAWWERIDGEGESTLSFFWIEQEPFSNSVRMSGTSYDKNGERSANWKSAMSRVVPRDNKIEYLWQGAHPKGDANVDFHGFGEITFDGPSNSKDQIIRGTGRFWSVDQAKKKATLKAIRLRRVQDGDSLINTMRNGKDSDIAELVGKTITEW
jgi:hypothetical protein